MNYNRVFLLIISLVVVPGIIGCKPSNTDTGALQVIRNTTEPKVGFDFTKEPIFSALADLARSQGYDEQTVVTYQEEQFHNPFNGGAYSRPINIEGKSYLLVTEIIAPMTHPGGNYRMSFTNFRTGQSHAFRGTYIELKTNEQIRYTDKFEDPNMPGEIRVTVTLREVMCGTELTIMQENLPSQIPAEMCYLGWQESLTLLAHLVEPEIP